MRLRSTTSENSDVTLFQPSPTGWAKRFVVAACLLALAVCAPAQVMPVITSYTPTSAVVNSGSFTLTINGSGFLPGSNGTTVAWVTMCGAVPVVTTYVSSIQITAAIPGSLLNEAYNAAFEVANPGASTYGTSFTVEHMVPNLTSVSPPTVFTGSGDTLLTLTGSGFYDFEWCADFPGSTVYTGTSSAALGYQSPTQGLIMVPAYELAVAGPVSISIWNTPPGGGYSGTITLMVVDPPPQVPPAILYVNPASMSPLTLVSPPVTIQIQGSGFTPSSQVFANGVAVSTSVSTATTLSAQIGPTVAQAFYSGGIALIVVNPGVSQVPVCSNTVALRVGPPRENQGTISIEPPVWNPGSNISLVIEGAKPNVPVTLVLDMGGFTPPLAPWPSAALNFALGVDPFDLTVVFDGMGILGPPTPHVLSGGGLTAPGGTFVLGGIATPYSPLGITVSLQAAYPDPTAAGGFRLTWALMPLIL